MLYKLPSLAFDILDQISVNNTMTQEDLSIKLSEKPKNVKYAIRRLQENNILHPIPDLLDMRIVHYRLPTIHELSQIKDEVDPDLFSRISGYVSLQNDPSFFSDPKVDEEAV